MMNSGRMDLNGYWRLRWADGERGGRKFHAEPTTDDAKWLDAIVPGEVHLDLIRAGLLREPTLGTNCLEARWVEECFWSYRRTFTPPAEALTGQAWLLFEGLDYAARIFLNGEEIGRHANYFYPCRINVTGKMNTGENVLVVELESGLFHAAEKSVAGYHGTQVENAFLTKRLWLRKPQCSFGWDWAPRLLNVGIHKPVSLEWASVVRADQLVVLSDLNEDLTRGHWRVRYGVEGLDQEHRPGRLHVMIEETGQTFSRDIEVPPGLGILEMEGDIDHPKLWWPVGQGEQSLYTFRVWIEIDGEKFGEQKRRTGFRKVRINQDPHPQGGRYFIFEINHRPIFIKGACLVPADIIYARLDRARYETLVDRALEANFNFLRVWGGGLYESDDFYELCDERGILVWQEFIFACGGYPATDDTFMQNITNETTYQIRRLASHPSLVVWCGNNEIHWENYERREGVIYPDHSLYHFVLPRLLSREDPCRYYQPSSPYSPEPGVNPNADPMGDQHPWSIGFGDIDFRKYRDMTCRFPDEGGMLGPNSLPALHACLPKGQKFMNSFAWQIHDNSVEFGFNHSAPDRIIREWTNLNPRELSLEDFIYYGGLIHGEALSEYIDNFRRRKFDSAAAVFWMYNDCWPTTRSWTIVDYLQNRTPAFYPVRRSCAPVKPVVVREGNWVRVLGVNDTPEAVAGNLRYGLFTLSGEYILDRSSDVILPANVSVELARFDAAEWDRAGIDRIIAFAMLSDEKGLLARHRLVLPRFCELKWAPAKPTVRRDGEQVFFNSSTFAWGLCLDLEGVRALPDNFFDLWPGMDYALPWPSEHPLPEIIRIGNLCD
ncbi:MAG: hypothetical protein GX629_02610 [Phycisphaerae bacterium]|nr:hypothetical protein [Phycisphaerae bacterium]